MKLSECRKGMRVRFRDCATVWTIVKVESITVTLKGSDDIPITISATPFFLERAEDG